MKMEDDNNEKERSNSEIGTGRNGTTALFSANNKQYTNLRSNKFQGNCNICHKKGYKTS